MSGIIETRQLNPNDYFRTKSAPHVSLWFHTKFALRNCCWLEWYTSRDDEKYSSRPDTCLCVVSLLQAWLSIPPKILHEILYTSTSFKSFRCQLYCIIVDSILNRQADYISSSIRLAAYTSMRRIAPLDVAAGQPGPLLVIRWLTVKEKRHATWHVFFLTGSYLSSQAASSQVLSTYKGLTTVFGMGTGGSP